MNETTPRVRLGGTSATFLLVACLLVACLGQPLVAAAAGKPAPVPTVTGGLSLPTVEGQLLSLVSEVQGAAVPAAKRASLLRQLGNLSAQLQGAEGIGRQLDNKNAALNLMLQAKADAMVAIDKIGLDLQVNLDELQANLDANVNANVNASVGGITVTVKANADTVRADLGAKADRLLVDIKADLNVIKIITLHARAHVDATRLAVTLHALVEKLTLDLSAVLKDLKVMAKANVKAALDASARLRASISAQVSGVRTQVGAGIDSRINLQLAGIARTSGLLNSILSAVSAHLNALQGQI